MAHCLNFYGCGHKRIKKRTTRLLLKFGKNCLAEITKQITKFVREQSTKLARRGISIRRTHCFLYSNWINFKQFKERWHFCEKKKNRVCFPYLLRLYICIKTKILYQAMSINILVCTWPWFMHLSIFCPSGGAAGWPRGIWHLKIFGF